MSDYDQYDDPRRDRYQDFSDHGRPRRAFPENDPHRRDQAGAGRSDQDDYYDRGLSRRGSSDSSSGASSGRYGGLGRGYDRDEHYPYQPGKRPDHYQRDHDQRRPNHDDYDRRRGGYNDNYGRGTAMGGSPYGGDNYSRANRGQGMGFAGYNGDEDRGYDQNGLRGGLGSSGGREDFSDRNFDQDRNPFRGGYGGGDYDQGGRNRTDLRNMNIGMNSRGPLDQRRIDRRDFDDDRYDQGRRQR